MGGLHVGDLAICQDSTPPRLFIAASATTWGEIGAAPTSGYVSPSFLGSGTADNTKFLRGDQSWAPAGAGAPGPQGNPGNSGAQGPAGPMSFIDADQGNDGQVGPQGAAGQTGASGSPGGQGPMGPLVFLEGDRGEDGPPGLQGNQGPAGGIGGTGPQGPAGPLSIMPGDPGEDAYPISPSSPNQNTTAVVTPAVPASTVASFNKTGTSVTAYIKGGTITVISIGATATGISAAAPAGAVHTVDIPANQSITLTYSVVPTWVWISN
jgi:hypothetical protein